MRRRGLRTEPWGTPLGVRTSGGFLVVYADELISVSDVEFEPGESSASDAENSFKAREREGWNG